MFCHTGKRHTHSPIERRGICLHFWVAIQPLEVARQLKPTPAWGECSLQQCLHCLLGRTLTPASGMPFPVMGNCLSTLLLFAAGIMSLGPALQEMMGLAQKRAPIILQALSKFVASSAVKMES